MSVAVKRVVRTDKSTIYPIKHGFKTQHHPQRNVNDDTTQDYLAFAVYHMAEI